MSHRSRGWNISSVLLLTVLTVGLSGQVSTPTSDVPSNQQVLAFLSESVGWYRHGAVERQIATEPADLVFLEDNRPLATQILQLSLDFARAEIRIATAFPENGQRGRVQADSSREIAQFVQTENQVQLDAAQTSQRIETIKNKLAAAPRAQRRELQAALDAAQSRLEVLQSGASTLAELAESVQAIGARDKEDLSSSVEDLARTVPELTNPAVLPQTVDSAAASISKPRDSGILGLSSEVSALTGKLSLLDDEIRRTDQLRQSSDDLRIPMLASIKKRFAAGVQNDLQGKDLAELQQQKARLEALKDLVNAVSPAVVALYKQRAVLDAYTSHLKNWRAAVVAQERSTWKNLGSRLVGAVVLIIALSMIGIIGRRATRHHVQDLDRHHILLVVQRVVLWFAIVLSAAFACASDLRSMATFFGLLAAGVAVALQSFIIALLSYFVLVGRDGIRIGDRVRVSEVTGDVSDMGWLQFRLREIDSKTQQPTGRTVIFANSFVLQSPGTGLFKFKQEGLKRKKLEVAAKASPS